MKSQLIILLLLLTLSSCRQWEDLTQPKPVVIDGLGSLQSVKDKQLNKEQLTKVIKALNNRQRVNDEDAIVMSDIYKRHTDYFLNASTMVFDNDEILSMHDVENYLSLLLRRENLRNEVDETTQEAITREIKKTARFDQSEFSGLGENAGNLAGGFVYAYNQTAAKDRTEKRAAYDNQQGRNKINIINGYEQAALEITKGEKANATAKEKQSAEQFLNDLKEYNESLPANGKILDANGRLISPAKMSGRQWASMEDILSNETNSAGDRLSNQMQATYDKLLNTTSQRV